MPRDGSGNYTLPYPAVVDGTTIESAVHNGTMSDIALQLNGPLPIIAGGTGANNAHDAMIALKGEISQQGGVTNYDTFPFVNGSFYSDAGATGAPNGNAFTGIYYSHLNPAYATIEARELLGAGIGRLFLRSKNGGTWGAWAEQSGSVADLDARYVNLTGDTMTGALTAPSAVLNDVNGLIVGQSADAGVIRFGNTGSKYIYWTGTQFTVNGGPVFLQDTTASTSPTTGALTVAGGVGIARELNVGGSAAGFVTHQIGASNASFANIAVHCSTGNVEGLYSASTASVALGAYSNHPLEIRTNNVPRINITATGDVNIPTKLAVNTALAGVSQFGSEFSCRGGQVEFGHANTAGYGCVLSNDTGGGNPYLLFNGSRGTTAGTYKTSGFKGSMIKSDMAGGLEFAQVATANADNQAQTNMMSVRPTVVNIPLTTGTNSQLAGALVVAGGVGISGTMCMGPSPVNVGAATALKVGYLGGGTQYGLSLRCGTDGAVALIFLNAADGASGSINTTTSTTTYNTSSDGRLKEDLKSFDAGNVVDQTEVYDFAWKTTGERSYGVIAQQAMEVYPTAVTYLENEDWYGIDYSKYVPVLLQELKALRARVAALEGGATIGAQPAKKK
jgi:hypothetical protein